MNPNFILPLSAGAVAIMIWACSVAMAQVQAVLPARSVEKERARNLGERIGELLQQKDYTTASQLLEETLSIDPENAQAKSLFAAVLIYQKKYDEAEEIYSKLKEREPENMSFVWNSAEIDFLRGQYAAARAKLEQLREKSPNDEMIIYKMALTYLFEDQPEQAETEINKIRFPSDTAAYYYGRAALALKAGQKEEGLKWTAEAARIFPYGHNALFADSLIEKGLMTTADVAATGPSAPSPLPPPAPPFFSTDVTPGLLGASAPAQTEGEAQASDP